MRTFLLACFCAALAYAQGAARITISGDIPSRPVLTAEDLSKMPREKVSVAGQDGTKVEYEGVPLREILKRAGAPMEKELRGKALARYVLATAHDGYQVVFTLAEVAPEFANQPILVADKRDGKPLFGYQGPFRLVCRGWAFRPRNFMKNQGLKVGQALPPANRPKAGPGLCRVVFRPCPNDKAGARSVRMLETLEIVRLRK
jgi:hypothetical protein